jgi:hypothetical protein
LKYDSEVWVLNKKGCQKLETAQMKFLRSPLGLKSSDHQRNATIREKLKVEHTVDGIQSYHSIDYNMLKEWNTHEYPGWHWNTKHKANAI